MRTDSRRRKWALGRSCLVCWQLKRSARSGTSLAFARQVPITIGGMRRLLFPASCCRSTNLRRLSSSLRILTRNASLLFLALSRRSRSGRLSSSLRVWAEGGSVPSLTLSRRSKTSSQPLRRRRVRLRILAKMLMACSCRRLARMQRSGLAKSIVLLADVRRRLRRMQMGVLAKSIVLLTDVHRRLRRLQKGFWSWYSGPFSADAWGECALCGVDVASLRPLEEPSTAPCEGQ